MHIHLISQISPSPLATHEAAGCHRLRVSVEEDVLHEADQTSGEQLRENVNSVLRMHLSEMSKVSDSQT